MNKPLLTVLIILISISCFPQKPAIDRGMKPISTTNQEENNGEKRIALVIGNSKYANINPLKNPGNDARLMKKTLESLGFDVTMIVETNLIDIKKAIADFGKKLSADKNSVGFFYYAGHGAEIRGKNYLIPIETPSKIENEAEASLHLVDLDILLNQINDIKNRLNVIVLDACRDDPFALNRSSGGSAAGIVSVSAPTGTLIAYATRKGYTASDGEGGNGLYTQELVKHLQIPNLKIEEVFKLVRTQVRIKSKEQQNPREENGIEGDFYLKIEKTTAGGGEITTPPSVIPGGNNSNNGESKIPILFNRNFFGYFQGGEYSMGSGRGDFTEKPVRKVTIGSFIIGIKEVTMGEYLEFCEKTGNKDFIPNSPPWGYAKELPVSGVSWFDAIEYCNWKSETENLVPCYKKTGLNVTWNTNANGYRLPTEAEWEFIAKEGQINYPYQFSGSNDINSVGWTSRNSNNTVHVGGSFAPNGFGVYDMTGNVWEWCWDWYAATYYQKQENNNPTGPVTGTTRVLRGGSWSSDDTPITYRHNQAPTTKSFDIGFRIVRSSR